MLYFYAGYLLVMNCVCFFMMGADKRFAKVHHRRIPERTLFAAAWAERWAALSVCGCSGIKQSIFCFLSDCRWQ